MDVFSYVGGIQKYLENFFIFIFGGIAKSYFLIDIIGDLFFKMKNYKDLTDKSKKDKREMINISFCEKIRIHIIENINSFFRKNLMPCI